MTLREQLLEMADPGYRDFVMPLMPGVERVIGIRLPQLRRLAREIVRGDWRAWLLEAETLYFEERMLQGLVVSCAPCPIEERLHHTARFVPLIDNWAVCDSFCWKVARSERPAVWRFILPYFRSRQPYDVRFAVVMALRNFADEEHIGALLDLLGRIRHDHYYVRMGVAWAVSVCFVHCPEATRRWLAEACPLDDWTYNKSLQKIAESLRVDDAARREIRALKRRTEKRAGQRNLTK